MQPHPLPSEMKSVTFNGVLWGSALKPDSNALILDVRDESKKTGSLYHLDLATMLSERLSVELDWWEELIGATDTFIFTVKYPDKNDPTLKEYQEIMLETGVRKVITEINLDQAVIDLPSVYETGTEFHKTVADFLSIELPLSCEYYEIGDNIIISYYIRSELGFSRYLLLLTAGKKSWKVLQDEKVKGFAPGAFFVLNNQIIFVRERNEVCIYDL